MKKYPLMNIGILITLGLLLILHPIWITVDKSLFAVTISGSQGFTMLGWVYLLTGIMTGGAVYWSNLDKSPQSLLGATLVVFPVLVVVFRSELTQLTPPVELHWAFGFALLLFPVALAFPMGIATRVRCWRVLAICFLLWTMGWILLPVVETGSLLFFRELFSPQFFWVLEGVLFIGLLLLPAYVSVLPFVFISYISGVLFYPGFFDGEKHTVNSQNLTDENGSVDTE